MLWLSSEPLRSVLLSNVTFLLLLPSVRSQKWWDITNTKLLESFIILVLFSFNSLEPFCVQGSSFVNRLPRDSEKWWESPNQRFTFNLMILMESCTKSNIGYQSTSPTSRHWKSHQSGFVLFCFFQLSFNSVLPLVIKLTTTIFTKACLYSFHICFWSTELGELFPGCSSSLSLLLFPLFSYQLKHIMINILFLGKD